MTEELLSQIKANREEREDKQGKLEYLEILHDDLFRLLKDCKYDITMSERLCALVKEATDSETQSVIKAMLKAGMNEARIQVNRLALDIDELDVLFKKL